MPTLLMLAIIGQSWPAEPDWVDLVNRTGASVTDVTGDSAGGGLAAFDIVGDSTDSAGFWTTDGTELFFRVRLADTPAMSPTKWNSMAAYWLFETDGDVTDGSYDFVLLLDGPNDELLFAANPAPSPNWCADSFDEPPAAQVYAAPPDGTGRARAIPAGTGLGGASDVFLDVAMPWVDFAAMTGLGSPNELLGRVVLGTGSNSAQVNKDVAGGLCTDAWSDLVEIRCGNGSLEVGEECDDEGLCDNNATSCTSEAECTVAGSTNCAPRSGDGCSDTCALEAGFGCYPTAPTTCEPQCGAVFVGESLSYWETGSISGAQFGFGVSATWSGEGFETALGTNLPAGVTDATIANLVAIPPLAVAPGPALEVTYGLDADGTSDCMRIYVNGDGSTSSGLVHQSCTNTSGIETVAIDVDAYAGSTQYVVIRFFTDGADNDHPGLFIESVELGSDIDQDSLREFSTMPDCDPCVDVDSDGWGVAAGSADLSRCTGGSEIDCADADPNVNPASVWYPDSDVDGYGDAVAAGVTQCDAPSGQHLLDNGDCDDDDNTVYPDAPELCDGILNNCNGSLPGTETDDDAGGGDGYVECSVDSGGWDGGGGIIGGDDCDDTSRFVYPGANETCGDGIDSDCNGEGGPSDDDDNDGLSFSIENALGTDDCDTDSDADGLSDGDEYSILGTDPADPDSDSDSVDDATEVGGDIYNPLNTDNDGSIDALDDDDDNDGVPTIDEDPGLDGNPTNDDTDDDQKPDYLDDDDDDDGLLTFDELFVHGTDPLSDDSDSDGLSDYDELLGGAGTDPLDADSDDDGLSDGEEVDGLDGTPGSGDETDANDPDTDDDGLCDDTRVDNDGDGTGPADACIESEATHGTSPVNDDTDSDGLSDYDEVFNTGTNPIVADTDDDGTNDGADGCPLDGQKTAAGVCGCGTADTDTDGDSRADCVDGCPNDIRKTEAGGCGCGVEDTDTDGDDTLDCNEDCDDDPDKTTAGICGCGVADTDTDGDETADCNDECDDDVNKTEAGTCGCGVAETDSDSDGAPDCTDECDSDANKVAAGTCGCGFAETDSDSDGTPDCNDACEDDPDKTVAGICGCGATDADGDSDGTPDCVDACPADAGKTVPGACGCGNTEQPDCGSTGGGGNGEGDPDSGCGCQSSSSPGIAVIGLLALAVRRRRKRR